MPQGISENQHYVPRWYQRRFLPAGRGEFFVYDRNPLEWITDRNKIRRRIKKPRYEFRSGANEPFVKKGLYNLDIAGIPADILERILFGPLDEKGSRANTGLLDWPKARGTLHIPNEWKEYRHDQASVIENILKFLDAQRSRTPKGIHKLRSTFEKQKAKLNNNQIMILFEQNRFRNITVWYECVWEFFSREQDSTPFLLSDNPCTIYNSECFPLSSDCRYPHDPDPFWKGTRILHPLSPDKLLTLSHPEWVDNPRPRQAKNLRRNARIGDEAIFNWTD